MRTFMAVGLLLAGLPASARTLVVRSGQSIRAALARAAAGDRVEVLPGTYREGGAREAAAIAITRDRIELVGLSAPGHPVILQNAGGQSYGVWVSPQNSLPGADDEQPPCGGPQPAVVKGFSIRGFTIRGFAVHGVHLACVDGFSILDNRSEDNSVYGLFPVRSRHGLMAGNVVTGTTDDAAVYVGQSEDVLIAGNRVFGNLLGIEIENSGNCAAVANEVHGNTAGILVDLLPELQRTTQENTLIAFNSVHDNNLPNKADEGILSVVPAGVGVLVVSGRNTAVLANDVRRNGFTGIAVASFCLALALQGSDLDCQALGIDPDPKDDRIVGNRLKDNGFADFSSNPFFESIKGDLIWDGSGSGNCWSNNSFTPSAGSAQLPACR
jgi:parallel beta-helix repeat protein